MVEISEIVEEEPQPAAAAPSATTDNVADLQSQERLSDADEIEAAMTHITRPSARLHLENLITKLRKEGKVLKRVAASKASSSAASSSSDGNGKKSTTAAAAAAPIPQPPAVVIPKRSPAKAPIISTNKYQSFPTYYFDAGKYNSPTVSVYVPLENIGAHDKSKIDCSFTSSSFDLIVTDWGSEGKAVKSYRLLNDNLDKDIDVSKSKYIIKPNKIILKLGKVKGEYGFESWSDLTAKKGKKASAGKKDDPSAGIMDMMKDMYDSGDDNMKKMIGETMYKQRTGQLGKDDMGMGGMGGMGDMMGGMGGMGM